MLILSIRIILLGLFIITNSIGPQPVQAQAVGALPMPGTMVELSKAYVPLMIKGVKVDPKEPFQFDFIVDTGDTQLSTDSPQLKEQSNTLIKYFLTALTIPEKDLWVNLSPYEKDRIIPDALGQTEMGRDMLAQDYILKQLTASLIYPEKELGKTFWDKVYSKAQAMYGTSEVPVNTFNKVWIVADKADVYEKGNSAFVVGGHLKVMLAEDYLAMNKNNRVPAGPAEKPFPAAEPIPGAGGGRYETQKSQELSSQIIKEVIIPILEEEVNQGQHFAPLRQMFYAMILASWYKQALRNSVMAQLYGNQNKVSVGIDSEDPTENARIYERYVQAYKTGVFNLIKEDIDESTHEMRPRKYFSGGVKMLKDPAMLHVRSDNPQPNARGEFLNVKVGLKDPAMGAKSKQSGQFLEAEKRILRRAKFVRYIKELNQEPDRSKRTLKGSVSDLATKWQLSQPTISQILEIYAKKIPRIETRKISGKTERLIKLFVDFKEPRFSRPLEEVANDFGVSLKTVRNAWDRADVIREYKGRPLLVEYAKGRPHKPETLRLIDDLSDPDSDLEGETSTDLGEEYGINPKTALRARDYIRVEDQAMSIKQRIQEAINSILQGRSISAKWAVNKIEVVLMDAEEYSDAIERVRFDYDNSRMIITLPYNSSEQPHVEVMKIEDEIASITDLDLLNTESWYAFKRSLKENKGSSRGWNKVASRKKIRRAQESSVLEWEIIISAATTLDEIDEIKSQIREPNNLTKKQKRGLINLADTIDLPMSPGGIDLNRDNMQMNISQDKAMGGVDVSVDPDMIESMKQNDFEGFEFSILSITPSTLN